MPIYQQLVNFDDEFHQLPEVPIIINDLSDDSEDDKEYAKNLLTYQAGQDLISLIPSCSCGAIKGEYSIGVKCPECNSVVRSDIENDITSLVWLRTPVGVDKLINPMVWIMLKDRFTKSGFDVMEWFVNTSYRPATKRPPILDKIIEAGFPRGYNNFIKNFDEVTDFLLNLSGFKARRNTVDYLAEVLKRYRDCIFSDYLPLPNKTLLIIEKTYVGIYADPLVINALDAIQMLVSIDNDFYDQNPRVKENRTIKAISKLCVFYEEYIKEKLSPKPGQFRKHIYGSRTGCSARGIISSLTHNHVYDEVHIPWAIGLTIYRPHLVNKLFKHGYTHNDAIGLLAGHTNRHHDLLRQFLDELISESGNKLYVILQRNPSLLQGSALRFRIGKFKTAPKTMGGAIDSTISLPIECVTSLNADFDGDAVNISACLDRAMGDYWYPLSPEFNIYQLSGVQKTGRNITIPKPIISTISSWISE